MERIIETSGITFNLFGPITSILEFFASITLICLGAFSEKKNMAYFCHPS